MKAVLVKEYKELMNRQRFYRLSEKIIKGAGLECYRNIPKSLIENDKPSFKDEYKHLIPDNVDGWDLICISDARTHTERLVFCGAEFNGEYGRLRTQIDGKHTFMTQGGSDRHVHKDEVYLRHLAKINGLKFEGIQTKCS